MYSNIYTGDKVSFFAWNHNKQEWQAKQGQVIDYIPKK